MIGLLILFVIYFTFFCTICFKLETLVCLCLSKIIFYQITELRMSLSERVFGQPLVNELVNILQAHKEALHDKNKSNKKALVISLHGWPGVGKNYASTMIAEALYKKGMDSKYVKLFMGKKDFGCANLQQKKVNIILFSVD